jgi:C-terminal processing protease CtpA/Prc
LFLTVANYYNAGSKPILEDGVTPSEVVRAAAEEDSEVGDDGSASSTSKEAPSGPRPLSPEDPIFHKALDLLKTPAKKAA